MAGVSSGPTPWWQLPEYAGSRQNLESSAPAGYEYDPVRMQYGRTPASAGSRVAQFTGAAMGGGIPSLDVLGGNGGAASGATGGTGGPVTGGSSVAPMQMPDMSQSNSAIFAQAKDKVGKLSRASLDSLSGELGSQGMLGSGAQVQGTRDIIQSGAGELGQVDRDLASKQADTALDVGKTNYAGALTQRGQDIGAQEANARLALEQRQQQYSLLSMILGSLDKTGGAASQLY
jgi:hypothetical protein